MVGSGVEVLLLRTHGSLLPGGQEVPSGPCGISQWGGDGHRWWWCRFLLCPQLSVALRRPWPHLCCSAVGAVTAEVGAGRGLTAALGPCKELGSAASGAAPWPGLALPGAAVVVSAWSVWPLVANCRWL